MVYQPSEPTKIFFTTINKRIAFFAIAIFVASYLLANSAIAADATSKQMKLKQIMQEQIKMMKPELQKKVKALSPETKKSLMKILAQHSRYSKTATLRQVMTEVLSDYQSMLSGIMTENPEQTADSAMRLANHRIPVGGLLPYMGMKNITDDRLAVLETFNDSVEGNAKQLAKAARAGNMSKAATLVGSITTGCVGCHAVFRSKPGQSDLLR